MCISLGLLKGGNFAYLQKTNIVLFLYNLKLCRRIFFSKMTRRNG